MHLSERELIDAIEGTLAGDRQAHVAACERCTRETARLAAMLRETREIDVPEPSPLFWDQFKRRVLAEIDAPPSNRRGRELWAFLRRPAVVVCWAGGALIAMIVILIVGVAWKPEPRPLPDHPVLAQRPAAAPPVDPRLDPDPEWMLLSRVADGIDWEAAEAVGLSAPPGAAERAAEQLSRDEQHELARLLRQEVGDGAGSI